MVKFYMLEAFSDNLKGGKTMERVQKSEVPVSGSGIRKCFKLPGGEGSNPNSIPVERIQKFLSFCLEKSFSGKIGPDMTTVLQDSAGRPYFFSMDTEKMWKGETGHHSPIFDMEFSPGGRHVVTGAEDEYDFLDGEASEATRTLVLWETHSGKCLWVRNVGYINACVFSPDGKYILCGNRHSPVSADMCHLRCSSTGNPVASFKIPCTTRVKDVAFHPSGATFVAFMASGVSIICDTLSGQVVRICENYSLGGSEGAPYNNRPRCIINPSGEAIGTFYGRILVVFRYQDGAKLAETNMPQPIKNLWWAGPNKLMADNYSVEIENLDSDSSAIVTAVRLWNIVNNTEEELLSVLCPFCHKRCYVSEQVLGQEVSCNNCEQALRLNPFIATM